MRSFRLRSIHWYAGTLLLGGLLCLIPTTPLVGATQGATSGESSPSETTIATRVAAWNVIERSLPSALDRVRDLRWGDAQLLYLAVTESGLFALPLAEDREPDLDRITRLTRDGNGSDEIWLTARVGASEDLVVVGSALFSFGWQERGKRGLLGKSYFLEGIEDLDVEGNRVALLGVRRSENGHMAPEGYIAWSGTIDGDEVDLRPLLASSAGPGARPVESCGTFEIGGIRFLSDESVIVVPGAESGAYRYGSEGELMDVWDTEALKIGADCTFDDATRDLYSGHPHPRWAYLNQFQTVDEILVIDGRPALVVRRVEKGHTHWDLIFLREAGTTSERIPLPVTSGSDLAHLRGDVRGDEMALLIFDEAIVLPAQDPRRSEALRPRLLFIHLPEALDPN